jgi:hypothetical protein
MVVRTLFVVLIGSAALARVSQVAAAEPSGVSAAATQHAIEERVNLCAIAAQRGTPTPAQCQTPSPMALPTGIPTPTVTATAAPTESSVRLPDFGAQSIDDPKRGEDFSFELPTDEPAPENTPAPTLAPVPHVRPPVVVIAPARTSALAPEPTYTPQPTYTPLPTSTSYPTMTAVPTATATTKAASVAITGAPVVSPTVVPTTTTVRVPAAEPESQGVWSWRQFGIALTTALTIAIVLVWAVLHRKIAVWSANEPGVDEHA